MPFSDSYYDLIQGHAAGENLHKDHRQRMRERFLSEGLDTFAPHNILELLLFYSIPQRDTNEIAHALLREFKTIPGVFDAAFEQLVRIDGVKDNTATLLKLIPALSRIYSVQKDADATNLNTLDKLGKFLCKQFVGITVETVLMLSLDNKRDLIDCAVLHRGSVNSAQVSVRKIAEIAIARNASAVALAHNHPSGLPIPSSEDVATTMRIKRALALLEIDLLEHVIVAGERYMGICEKMGE